MKKVLFVDPKWKDVEKKVLKEESKMKSAKKIVRNQFFLGLCFCFQQN